MKERPRSADSRANTDDMSTGAEKKGGESKGIRVTRRRALGAIGIGVAAAGVPGLAAAAERAVPGGSGRNGGDDSNRRDGERDGEGNGRGTGDRRPA